MFGVCHLQGPLNAVTTLLLRLKLDRAAAEAKALEAAVEDGAKSQGTELPIPSLSPVQRTAHNELKHAKSSQSDFETGNLDMEKKQNT